jgi:hypothetical protein
MKELPIQPPLRLFTLNSCSKISNPEIFLVFLSSLCYNIDLPASAANHSDTWEVILISTCQFSVESCKALPFCAEQYYTSFKSGLTCHQCCEKVI